MVVTVEEYKPTENYLGPPVFHLRSDKFNTTYIIEKSIGGYSFFHIKVDKGNLAKELRSKFSTYRQAIEAFEAWERKQSDSKTVQRDKRAAAREEEKKAVNAD